MKTTRCFAAGAFQFAVATTSDDDRRLIEALFTDLPSPTTDTGEPSVLSLLRDGDDGTWFLSTPQLQDQGLPTLGLALSLLVSHVNLCALDAEPEHLHVHASVATRDGRAVIIAADRDTGKTTSVAHLVRRGWGFVTDETARLTPGSSGVTGFAKPLSVKLEGRHHVEHLEPFMIPPVGDGTEGFYFVPIGTSGATVVDGGEPHLVVLLRRPLSDEPGTGPTARRLHAADAVVALMQQTLDAERFGSAAFQLATLAATTHCCELTMGTPDETVLAIESLFELDPVEALAVALHPPSAAFTPGVVTVTIDGRAVVHDADSGVILALDEGATLVWWQLAGWSKTTEIDIQGPVIQPFVSQLRELGVLAAAG
jgi:hypothetical protein